jgi:hypothetical protein
MLYAAAWRAARALGYRRMVTYTLESEQGASLRAAGWMQIRTSAGGPWARPSRFANDLHPLGVKRCWQTRVEGEYPVVTWPTVDTGQLVLMEASQ